MKIVRSKTFKKNGVTERVSIQLDHTDLTEEESAPALKNYRAFLLELRAEKHIVASMRRMGAYHRNRQKSDEIADAELTTLNTLYNAVIGRGK